MTNAEKITAIYAVAKKNGVHLNRSFNPEYFVQNSFETIGEGLGTAVLDNMWEKCRYGVNNGLRNVAAQLDGLSDVAVALTTVKAKNSDFVAKQKNAADKMMNTPLPGKNVPDMLKPVGEYIASTLEFIDYQLAATPDNKYLSDAKDKLNKLNELSGSVADTSSVEAKAIAEKIIDGINGWRKQAASRSLSLVATQALDKVIADMKDWCERTAEVGSRQNRQASMGDVPVIESDSLDDVMRIAAANDLYNVFVAQIEESKNEMDELNAELEQARREWMDEKNQLKAEIDSIKEEQNECVVRAQNGYDYEQNLERFAELKEQLADLTEQYEDTVEPDYFVEVKDRMKARRLLHDTVNGLAKRLKFERKADYFPELIIEHCHIHELLALLNGTADDSLRAGAQKTIEVVNNVMTMLANQDKEFINNLRKGRQKMKSKTTQVQIEKVNNANRQTAAANKNAAIEDEFAKLVAGGDTNTVQQQPQQVNPILNKPISGDDN